MPGGDLFWALIKLTGHACMRQHDQMMKREHTLIMMINTRTFTDSALFLLNQPYSLIVIWFYFKNKHRRWLKSTVSCVGLEACVYTQHVFSVLGTFWNQRPFVTNCSTGSVWKSRIVLVSWLLFINLRFILSCRYKEMLLQLHVLFKTSRLFESILFDEQWELSRE